MTTLPTIDLGPLIDTINQEHYAGKDVARSLVHFAMKDILAPYGVSHDHIRQLTLIGGTNDCGVDGWFVDNESDTPFLYLFQGKGGGELKESELSDLWDAPKKLLDANRAKNSDAAQLAHDLRDWLNQGVLMSLHFVATGDVGPAALATAKRLSGEMEYVIQQSSGDARIPCDFRLWRTDDLQRNHHDLLRLGGTQSIRHSLRFASHGPGYGYIEAPPEAGTNTRTIVFLAYAVEIAKIFNGPVRWTPDFGQVAKREVLPVS